MKKPLSITLNLVTILIMLVSAGVQSVSSSGDQTQIVPTQVVATISVGERPRAVAFSPDSTLAFVSHEGEATVKVVRLSDHAVIETIVLGQPVPNYNLLGLGVTPDGQYLYVNWRDRHVVVPIRLSDSAVLPEIPVGSQPMGLSIAPDGTRVYTAGEGGVDVIQTSTNSVVAHIDFPPDAYPYAVVISPDGAEAYVNDGTGHKVYIIRTVDNTIVDSISVGRGPHHDLDVTPDGTMIYTTGSQQGTVEAVRLSDRQVESIYIEGGPSGIAVTPDGEYVYASAYNTDRVSVIRTADHVVIDHIPVGARPDGIIDISPDGRYLYVPNRYDNTVSVITITPPGPPPVVGTFEPNGGSGSVGEWVDFTTTFSDPDGYQDIGTAVFLLSRRLNPEYAGMVAAYHQPSNLLWLRGGGSCVPGQADLLTTNYVTLDCGNTSVQGAGETMTITWRVRPEQCFIGGCDLNMAYGIVSDGARQWDAGLMGTWMLDPGVARAHHARPPIKPTQADGSTETLPEPAEGLAEVLVPMWEEIERWRLGR